MTADSGVDSEGAGGARAPPEFGGSEKRIEREIGESIRTSTPGFEKLCTVLCKHLAARFLLS